MLGREMQESSFFFKELPVLRFWTIALRYNGSYGPGALVRMGHTPNNTIGEHVWLQVECDQFPPDSTFVNLYTDIPSRTAPPRYYLLQVSFLSPLYLYVPLFLFLSACVCPSVCVFVFPSVFLYVVCLSSLTLRISNLFLPVCLHGYTFWSVSLCI